VRVWSTLTIKML